MISLWGTETLEERKRNWRVWRKVVFEPNVHAKYVLAIKANELLFDEVHGRFHAVSTNHTIMKQAVLSTVFSRR